MFLLSYLLRSALGALLLVTVVPWALKVFQARAHWPPPQAGWVYGGLAFGVALMCLRRPQWLLHTFLHESAHALVAICLGVRVRSFQASDGQGGQVVHSRVDPFRTTLIAIAPYTLPLLLVPAILWHRLVEGGSPWLGPSAALLAACWVHHLHGLYHNIRLNSLGRQSDLMKVGHLLAVPAIVCALLASTAWALDSLRWW